MRAGRDVIPPQRVKELLARAEGLDLPRIRDEFHRAASEEVCEMVPDGETMVNWVLSLTEGLRQTAKAGRGVLLAAA